ncbi:hypothetical protein C3K47_19270 [Solitalea longa]|uniref:Uncharacterized protein n=2 Tax=Solitalea longa TaxID=2079460 RepID=A0A2S4ZW84_9SPHI|nr:hypothetical protein C3K47_19270 [Solitalea longa]
MTQVFSPRLRQAPKRYEQSYQQSTMKISKGDIFSIQTKKGLGYMQFVETTEFGDYVRILDHISDSINQSDVDKLERWCITFVIKPALRRKIISFIGNYNLPLEFKIQEYARSEHNVRGEFLGWHIVNRKTLQRQLKNSLTQEEIKLSPSGFWNDTLIIERLESDWKLSEWK